MVYFSEEQVTEAMKAVVAGREDYVYEFADSECLYAIDGAPSCVVGHVIHRLDPELFKQVEDWERNTGYGNNGVNELLYESGLGIDAPMNVVSALERAQELQDSGNPWRDALNGYILRLEGEYYD